MSGWPVVAVVAGGGCSVAASPVEGSIAPAETKRDDMTFRKWMLPLLRLIDCYDEDRYPGR